MSSVSNNLLVFLAALVVSGMVLIWLINVVKMTIQVALTIAVLVLLLQLGFGIDFQQLAREIQQLPQTLWNLLRGSR